MASKQPDHTGDPSLFPKSTSLVGPGFKSNKQTYPGYPVNPDSLVCQDAMEGRDLVELEFDDGLDLELWISLEVGVFIFSRHWGIVSGRLGNNNPSCY